MGTTKFAGGRARQRATRFSASLAVFLMLVTGSVVTVGIAPASASDYPSWSDVVKARHNEATRRAQVKHIRRVLKQLEADVIRTEADSREKGDIYQAAEEAWFTASIKADELQSQADAAAKTAHESEVRAGQLAAQAARSGGGDLTINLLLSGENATDLLARMGQASKVSQQAKGIYDRAVQDKNTAQALTDQADVAKRILKQLKTAAQAAFKVAQAAADKAAAALASSQKHKAELEAQLTALTSNRKLTEKKYLKGVQARYGAGAGLGAGQISSSGWAKPANGYISSGFGMRFHPIEHVWRLHTGTDIAGAGCGAPIYAAHGGTVIYAGWYGTYGNFILIQHSDGMSTGYAHIVNGGILVRQGQSVGVGQHIAREGTTGASTGCHLHFEVRHNGVAQNAVPWMRAHGIILG